jgi:putative PEP-CTERM system histidine kinase
MLVGPERMRTPYTAEDLQFLVTAGEQAAGAIITARLSETLARAREFEAFHRLTSFVIHDVKNSIASLSLLTENALKHFEDPEFQRDAITTLSRTVERMQRLLARLSGPPDSASLRFQPVDVAELAREAARTAGGRGGVVTDIVAVPAVEADAEALVRVFQNLVKNAAEALPSGEGVVTVRTHADAEWVVFSVQDTGCGMSEDFVRTSLFAPFRSTKRGGWGIGLYQSQSIVEAHGGRIEVTSKEGNGSTFVVRLPLPRGQA